MKIFTKKITVFLVFLLLTSSVNAEMRSENYIIHENVNYEFDGPVISSVSHSVSGTTVTVSWTTDIEADSTVVYSTIDGFTNGLEQGANQGVTSHSVELSGLESNTLYYYKVKSRRINGGLSISSQSSFTTGQGEGEAGRSTTVSGGGGVLIIDKTDKNPPEISELNIERITRDSVTVTWTTDEESTSFVEIYESESAKSTFGDWATTTNHSITVPKLEPETNYNLNVLSSDDWGNIGYSESRSFTTGKATDQGLDDIIAEEEGSKVDDVNNQVNSGIRGFFTRLFPQATLNQSADVVDIESLKELSEFMPLPILGGEPNVEINGNQATISWTSDIEASSQVAISDEDNYFSDSAEPYAEIIGNNEDLSTSHSVAIFGLQPNKTYHYQLRSKTELGPIAKSRDFTFITELEEFEISSHYIQILNQNEAVFKWVTNKESNSIISYTPYENNVVSFDKKKSIRDETVSVIHEMTLPDLSAVTYYDVELVSMDALGNIANKVIARFSTIEDDLPPEITDVKAESTVFVDQGSRIQTVISWKTNEPATSKIYYQEGVHGPSTKLSEESLANQDFSKEHVIVNTKFKPGTVYSFRVESINSGGNMTISDVNTFMTAKKKESIIQIILGILESTFGWLRKLL